MIRDAREVELDHLARMMADAYREYEPVMPAEAWRFYEADITAVHERTGDSRLIVWDDGGDLLGAVTYYPPGRLGIVPARWAYLRLLAVSPTARGRGIGRALVEEVIDRARSDGAEAVAIHTTAWMSTARDLYRARGFTRDPRYDVEPGINDS